MARYRRKSGPTQPDILITYNSLAEYIRDARKCTAGAEGREGFLGRPLNEACDLMMHGAEEIDMRPARDLMEKIDASFRDREMNQWEPSVQGAYPVVPEYLIGLPENMRTEVNLEDDRSPIKLVIEVSVSGGVGHSALVKRGAALSALAVRLGETRPVELWAMTAISPRRQRNVGVMVKLDTAPISLSQCVAVLADPAYNRRLSFAFGFKAANILYTNDVGWAWGYPSAPREKKLKEVFSLEETDIMIQGGFLPDEALMDRDPVKWVHDQIEKQRTKHED